MNKDIYVNNLSVSFNENQTVLENVSTKFDFGKITAIVGQSGCGKSILAMSILRLLSEKSSIDGEIFYKNKNLLALEEKEMINIRGKEIALIPQNPSEALNPILKIKKQLYEILNKKYKNNYKEKTAFYIKKVGFKENEVDRIKNSYSFELSGGMQQRIVSLFGIAQEAEWIIADEPTKGLDSFLREQIYNFFIELKKEKTSLIIITHDINLAVKLSDYIIVMNNGQIVEEGETKTVFENPLHDFTKILFDSIPSRGLQYHKYVVPNKKSELVSVENNRKVRVYYD